MTPAESPSTVLFQRLALVSAAVVTALAVLGITGLRFGITVLTSIRPDYKPISFSATVYWLILGVILAMLYWKRAAGRARLLMAVVIAVVGIAAATEIPFSIGVAGLLSRTFSSVQGMPWQGGRRPRFHRLPRS